MQTKQQEIESLIKMILSNEESSKMNMINMPKEFSLDKIKSLHMFLDTILTNYIDAIEFMTNEDFKLFQEFQKIKYTKNENN